MICARLFWAHFPAEHRNALRRWSNGSCTTPFVCNRLQLDLSPHMPGIQIPGGVSMTGVVVWGLRYRRGGGPDRFLLLSPGAPLTIGRGSESQVVLDDPE